MSLLSSPKCVFMCLYTTVYILTFDHLFCNGSTVLSNQRSSYFPSIPLMFSLLDYKDEICSLVQEHGILLKQTVEIKLHVTSQNPPLRTSLDFTLTVFTIKLIFYLICFTCHLFFNLIDCICV